MTHIVRDVEKPGSKLHKKEVRAAAAHSLSLHAFSPRLAPSAALLLLLLGKLCTMQTVHHAHLLPLLLLPLPAACLHTDPGAVKMTQTFKLNRTEHPVLTLFPRCPERPSRRCTAQLHQLPHMHCLVHASCRMLPLTAPLAACCP